MFALSKADYRHHRQVLDGLPLNLLFAYAVFDRPDQGEIHVDDPAAPRLFHIRHRYGMSLLVGAPGDDATAGAVLDHLLTGAPQRPEWLQMHPVGWEAVLLAQLARRPPAERDLLKVHRRQNFRHDGRLPILTPTPAVTIRPMQRDSFGAMAGSVVVTQFWDKVADFLEKGRGFDLFYDGRLAAQAFSAFLMDDMLEIGIETLPEWRGRGLARLVAGRLVADCLEHGLTPVWSCRRGNEGSFRLACGLGFVPTLDLPYLQLG